VNDGFHTWRCDNGYCRIKGDDKNVDGDVRNRRQTGYTRFSSLLES